MNFNISPAFEKCTEKLPKLAEKRHWKKRKKKNGWKMNRVENRYMTSLCDKLFGAGKKVSGHNWWMWTCTNVIGWLQISVYDTSQMLVDVNLHRCQFLVLQISDFSCWLMSTGRCQPAAQMSLVGWWPASFVSLARCHWWPASSPDFSWCHLTTLFHCCSLSEMSKMLCLLQWSILSSAPYPRIKTRAKGF